MVRVHTPHVTPTIRRTHRQVSSSSTTLYLLTGCCPSLYRGRPLRYSLRSSSIDPRSLSHGNAPSKHRGVAPESGDSEASNLHGRFRHQQTLALAVATFLAV